MSSDATNKSAGIRGQVSSPVDKGISLVFFFSSNSLISAKSLDVEL